MRQRSIRAVGSTASATLHSSTLSTAKLTIPLKPKSTSTPNITPTNTTTNTSTIKPNVTNTASTTAQSSSTLSTDELDLVKLVFKDCSILLKHLTDIPRNPDLTNAFRRTLIHYSEIILLSDSICKSTNIYSFLPYIGKTLAQLSVTQTTHFSGFKHEQQQLITLLTAFLERIQSQPVQFQSLTTTSAKTRLLQSLMSFNQSLVQTTELNQLYQISFKQLISGVNCAIMKNESALMSMAGGEWISLLRAVKYYLSRPEIMNGEYGLKESDLNILIKALDDYCTVHNYHLKPHANTGATSTTTDNNSTQGDLDSSSPSTWRWTAAQTCEVLEEIGHLCRLFKSHSTTYSSINLSTLSSLFLRLCVQSIPLLHTQASTIPLYNLQNLCFHVSVHYSTFPFPREVFEQLFFHLSSVCEQALLSEENPQVQYYKPLVYLLRTMSSHSELRTENPPIKFNSTEFFLLLVKRIATCREALQSKAENTSKRNKKSGSSSNMVFDSIIFYSLGRLQLHSYSEPTVSTFIHRFSDELNIQSPMYSPLDQVKIYLNTLHFTVSAAQHYHSLPVLTKSTLPSPHWSEKHMHTIAQSFIQWAQSNKSITLKQISILNISHFGRAFSDFLVVVDKNTEAFHSVLKATECLVKYVNSTRVSESLLKYTIPNGMDGTRLYTDNMMITHVQFNVMQQKLRILTSNIQSTSGSATGSGSGDVIVDSEKVSFSHELSEHLSSIVNQRDVLMYNRNAGQSSQSIANQVNSTQ